MTDNFCIQYSFLNFTEAWLQEAMRVADVQRQAERQQADRETREAQMHSIPFVKMEADEFLCSDVRLYACFIFMCLHCLKKTLSLCQCVIAISLSPR